MLKKTTRKIFAKAFRCGAGQSAQTEINLTILNAGLFFGILVCSFLLLLIWAMPNVKFATIVPIVFSAGLLISPYGIYRAVRRSRLYWQGKEGEKRVSELLEPILPKDNYILSAFPGGGYDIDFVLVGPSGVYAIEVKNPSVYTKDDRIIYKDGFLFIDSTETKRPRPLKKPDPLKQVRGNCFSLKKLLQEKLNKSYFIKGVVLFPDRYVNEFNEKGIMTFNPERFVSAPLAKAPPELEAYEVGNILRELRAHVKNVLELEQQENN